MRRIHSHLAADEREAATVIAMRARSRHPESTTVHVFQVQGRVMVGWSGPGRQLQELQLSDQEQHAARCLIVDRSVRTFEIDRLLPVTAGA